MNDWLLERAALGEAPDGTTVDADALAAALASIERSNAEILEALPPAMVAAEVERRLRIAERDSSRHSRRQLWVAGAVVVTAAAVALFVLWKQPAGEESLASIDPAELSDGTRIKGDPSLSIHRQVDGRPQRLAPGDEARAGDRLQLSYAAAGRRHGVILSIDGRGAVTLHHPSDRAGSTALVRGKKTPLVHSYRLDDAPRFERFFFVASMRPLDVADILRVAERLAISPQRDTATRLALPSHIDQISFTLNKVESSP